ncbi:MAG: type II secretion system protein [Nitrosomonadales bacterium]|nr:type II secretion system protein [Nitrosomonadales bacterium]
MKLRVTDFELRVSSFELRVSSFEFRVKPPASDSKFVTRNPKLKTRNSQSGFSLLELVIAICIITLLMGVFFNRVTFYQEQAEKAAMGEVVSAVQSALALQYVDMMLHGRKAEIAAMAMNNPLNWLKEKPRNYVGEFYAPVPGAIPPGNWAFDLKTRELVYVPQHIAHPEAVGKDKWIRYRVSLRLDLAADASGKSSQGKGGVVFEPVAP